MDTNPKCLQIGTVSTKPQKHFQALQKVAQWLEV